VRVARRDCGGRAIAAWGREAAADGGHDTKGDAHPDAFSQVSVLRGDKSAVHEPSRCAMQVAQVLGWVLTIELVLNDALALSGVLPQRVEHQQRRTPEHNCSFGVS